MTRILTQMLPIPATSQFTHLVINHLVPCLKDSGHLTQLLDSVYHLLILLVVKIERDMMSLLHSKSALRLVCIKVLDHYLKVQLH